MSDTCVLEVLVYCRGIAPTSARAAASEGAPDAAHARLHANRDKRLSPSDIEVGARAVAQIFWPRFYFRLAFWIHETDARVGGRFIQNQPATHGGAGAPPARDGPIYGLGVL